MITCKSQDALVVKKEMERMMLPTIELYPVDNDDLFDTTLEDMALYGLTLYAMDTKQVSHPMHWDFCHYIVPRHQQYTDRVGETLWYFDMALLTHVVAFIAWRDYPCVIFDDALLAT